MPGKDRLPDEALVVRCGKPPFGGAAKLRGVCVAYCGVFGFSVQSAAGAAFEELARWCPNNRIGLTTVRAIRALGYDVVVTPGAGRHATVAVAPDWSEEDAERLITLFGEQPNPAPRKS